MPKSGDPIVSAIILSYNHARFLPETLESVRAQTYNNLEAIVVDDCSTDDSVAIIERWVRESGRTCKFVRHEMNLGVCRVMNDGLAVATGKYVAILGSDDAWLPDKTERQVELMEAQPEDVGVVYTDALQMDEAGVALPGLHVASHWDFVEMPQGYILDTLLRGNFVAPLTTLVRRSCYDTVGVYDENLPWEDWDMWMRIAAQYRFLFLPRPLARYRVRGESMSHSDPARMLKDCIKIAMKQLRMAYLTDSQRSALTATALGWVAQLREMGDTQIPDLLAEIEQAVGWRARWMYRRVRAERLVKPARDRVSWEVRNFLWHPILDATRWARHPLGINRSNIRGLLGRR